VTHTKSSTPNSDMRKMEDRLKNELGRLKDLTKMGLELRLVWCPTHVSSLSGKIEESIIYIYEEDSGKALDVLRHEFFDYLVSVAITPYERAASFYRAMVNALIEKLGEEAYSEKERVVEAIMKTLEPLDL